MWEAQPSSTIKTQNHQQSSCENPNLIYAYLQWNKILGVMSSLGIKMSWGKKKDIEI